MRYVVFALVCFLNLNGQAWAEEVGTDVSDSYFKARKVSRSSKHFFSFHMGLFLKDTSTDWAISGEEKNKGKSILGSTYRFGRWGKFADLAFRLNYIKYNLTQESPRQISLSHFVMLPSVESQFPLYMGLGLGPGLIFSQPKDRSLFALNYSLIGGVRFFEVFGSVGTFLEAGYTGHVHLFSKGEFTGFYILGGLVLSI